MSQPSETVTPKIKTSRTHGGHAGRRIARAILAIAFSALTVLVPVAQADAIDDILLIADGGPESGDARPETVDTYGDWTLTPSVNMFASPAAMETFQECFYDPSQAVCGESRCFVVEECVDWVNDQVCEDFAFVDCNVESPSGCTDAYALTCFKQQDKGKIYETTHWALMSDTVTGSPPKGSMSDDSAAALIGCVPSALLGPEAYATCMAGAEAVIIAKKLNGDYDDTRQWDGYYETTWTGFGWSAPAASTGDPTNGVIQHTMITIGPPPVPCPFKAAGDEKAYHAAKAAAKTDCQAASLKFREMTGNADASVTYHVLLGLVDLHVTSSGTGAISLDGDTNVDLGYLGGAEVQEVSVLGLVDWDLAFAGAGAASTAAQASDSV